MQTIALDCGALRLELTPEIGGAISAFEWRSGGQSRPIMRPCPRPLQKVLDAASFPLVPYVNRIRDGSFRFRGRTISLQPNMSGDPSPLHGQGWLHPWSVEQHDDEGATIAFTHEPGEWPWRYEAQQAFSLDRTGLWATLTCRNSGDEPMPCGLGFHPYFPCGAETRIDTEVGSAWTVDEHVLPVDQVPATGRFDLRDRRVCGQQLDNGFGDWGGEARMEDPDWPYVMTLSSPTARFFQLYSPAEGGIFVAEPVSHANAALNAPEGEWEGLGMQVLEPGETMELEMRIEVLPR